MLFPSVIGRVGPSFVIDTESYYGTLPNIGGSSAAAAFPTANKVFYLPFRAPTALIVQQMFISNGAVSGNVDVGIYTKDGTRLVRSGSTAQAGASVLQTFNITDTLIGFGEYYMAVTLDNNTGELQRRSLTVPLPTIAGVLIETTGAFGLPAVASFTSAVDAYLPFMGLVAQSAL